VIASFFFWRKGTPLQRSLSGLFRSLLHDTLKQQPDLIPEVLPELWDEAMAPPAWHSPSPILEDSAVQRAFSRLLQYPNLYDHTKFCFFIDGLDEYEETLQDDFRAMVQLLSSWTKAAPNDIKLCVSSREYNVFLNLFSAEKRMRLQDLTLADMKRYVRERLQELPQEDLDSIVRAITGKADGIFLWVALVVKSIRSRLEDGFDASMIEEEVNALPDELEGLFQHLLDSIDKPYRTKAYQTFAMANVEQIAPVRPLRLSLLAYSFLDEYGVDSEFAQNPSYSLPPLTETTRSQREIGARKRLNAHCKGLTVLDNDGYLTHTHRSVVEFLTKYLGDTPTAKSVLAGFDPTHALCQLALAELRSRPNDEDWTAFPRHRLPPIWILIRCVVVARYAHRLDSPPYIYLEALRSAADSAVPEHHRREVLLRKEPPQYLVDDIWWDMTSVLDQCASWGMHEYVDYVTSVDPSTIDNNDKLARLALSAMSGAGFEKYQRLGLTLPSSPFSVLGVLLRRGISPNAAIHDNPYTERVSLPLGSTVWEQLIYILTLPFGRVRISEAGGIVEEFLKHGANSDINIALVDPVAKNVSETFPKAKVSIPPPERRWNPERWEHQVQGQDPQLPPSKGGIGRPAIEFRFGNDRGAAKVKTHSPNTSADDKEYEGEEARFYTFCATKGGKISLEDLIEFLGFENKERILELCAQNKLLLGASAETEPNAEGEVGNPVEASDNTGAGVIHELVIEGQNSPQTDPGMEVAKPAEPEAVVGNGPELLEQEKLKHKECKQKGLEDEEHKDEEPKHQQLKHATKTQTLYQQLLKRRAVDVTLGKPRPIQTRTSAHGWEFQALTTHYAPALLAALVLSQLLQVLN
jgi:hypothetical protein